MTEPTPAAPPQPPLDPTAPPPAPRDLTPRARRAAWTHPHVRFWWLVAAALLLGMAYLLVVETLDWSREVRLVESGAEVDAVVFDAGGSLKNYPIPPLANVDLTYTYNGHQYKVTGPLAERRKETLLTGHTMRIHIDPENPKVWTDRTTPPTFVGKMITPMLLLPPLAIAVAAALLSRRRVTSLWATGEPRQAVVVDTKQTPLAPLSQAVRCTLPGGRDKRLITVYLPHRAGKVAKGDSLWLVTHPKNPQRALPAAAFLN